MVLSFPIKLTQRLLRKWSFRGVSNSSKYSISSIDGQEPEMVDYIRQFLEADQDVLENENQDPEDMNFEKVEAIEGTYLTLETAKNALDDYSLEEENVDYFSIIIPMKEPQLASNVYINLAKPKKTFNFDGKKLVDHINVTGILGSIQENFVIYNYEAEPEKLAGFISACLANIKSRKAKGDTKAALEMWEYMVNFARSNAFIMPLEDLNLLLHFFKENEEFTLINDLRFLCKIYMSNYLYKIDIYLEDLVAYCNIIPTLMIIEPQRTFVVGSVFQKLANKIITPEEPLEYQIEKLMATVELTPVSRILLFYYLIVSFRNLKHIKIVGRLVEDLELTEEILETLPFNTLLILNKLKKQSPVGLADKFDVDLSRHMLKYCKVKDPVKEMSLFLSQIYHIAFLSTKVRHEDNPELFHYFDVNFNKWLDYVEALMKQISDSTIDFNVDPNALLVINHFLHALIAFVLHFELLLSTKKRIHEVFQQVQKNDAIHEIFVTDAPTYTQALLTVNGHLGVKTTSTEIEEKAYLAMLKNSHFRYISNLLTHRKHFSLHLTLRFEIKLVHDFMIFESPKTKMVILKGIMNLDNVMAEHYEIINDYLAYVDFETLDLIDLLAVFTKATPKIISKENLLKMYEFLRESYSEEAEKSMEKKFIIYQIAEDRHGLLKFAYGIDDNKETATSS